MVRYDYQWLNSLTPKRLVDIKELLMSEVIQTEALVNLLEKKGILTKTRTHWMRS